ncbi:MAG: LysR substrate-binding domain-containing protein, partial [Pseudomonadota bacterium]
PEDRFTYRATDNRNMLDAILAGAGLGFVISQELDHHPALKEVVPSEDSWSAPLWLVTHVDLHRTTKVQAFLKFLKAHFKAAAAA